MTNGVDELTRTTGEMACGQIPSRPFLIMGQYHHTDPTRQPEGKETAWVYSHVPQRVRGDAGGELTGRWDRRDETERFADRLQARVEQAAPGFGALIRHRAVAGPDDLQRDDANLVNGAINGGTANVHQLAMFRPIPAQGAAPRRRSRACSSPRPPPTRPAASTAPRARSRRAALRHHEPWRALRPSLLRRPI